MKFLRLSRKFNDNLDAEFENLKSEYLALQSGSVAGLEYTDRKNAYNRNNKNMNAIFRTLDSIERSGPKVLFTYRFVRLFTGYGFPNIRTRARGGVNFVYSKGRYKCTFRIRDPIVLGLLFENR